MPKVDYYKVLEIEENASQDEVKKAYRKLSMKWHPDKNQGNPDATNTFQKISEAYETLGDQERRQEYDIGRKNPFFAGGQQGGPHFADMDDLFSMFFGGGPPMSGPYPGMHQHHQNFPQGFPPGMAGIFGQNMGGPNIKIFRNGVHINPMMEKPQPIVKHIDITMEQVLTGCKLPIEIERWVVEGHNKVHENVTIYVEIFKGIDSNEIIVLKDEGNVVNDMCKGDVKIFVKVQPHPRFERKGLDLIYLHNISLKEALCGFSFELKHLNGKSYTINNKAGNIIPPNFQKNIANMGLTREGHSGAMFVHFHVEFPETLTPEQLENLTKIL